MREIAVEIAVQLQALNDAPGKAEDGD